MKNILLRLCIWILSKHTLIWEVIYTLSLNLYNDIDTLECKSYVFALSTKDAKEKLIKYYKKEGIKCTINCIGGAIISADTDEIM